MVIYFCLFVCNAIRKRVEPRTKLKKKINSIHVLSNPSLLLFTLEVKLQNKLIYLRHLAVF